MQAAKAQGGLTLQRLLDMEDQGVAIADVTSDELRASLYSKEVKLTFSRINCLMLLIFMLKNIIGFHALYEVLVPSLPSCLFSLCASRIF